jgi:hypothetical protein
VAGCVILIIVYQTKEDDMRRIRSDEQRARYAANAARRDKKRRDEFRAQLAEIEAANAKALSDHVNRDLVGV